MTGSGAWQSCNAAGISMGNNWMGTSISEKTEDKLKNFLKSRKFIKFESKKGDGIKFGVDFLFLIEINAIVCYNELLFHP